jgi:membrane protein implicated in regulation of membrane protease activity
MEFKVLFWHWLVFGMLLMIVEVFLPGFVILWFGLGAILVSLLMLVLPDLPFSWQLFCWAMSSAIFTALWFRYFKPLMKDRTKAGISREAALGESGLVVRVPAGHERGVVRFTTPLLGAEEWPFICDEKVSSGDRVFVREISGNTLIVGKHPLASALTERPER